MKRVRKLLTNLIVILMTASFLAGCDSGEVSKETSQETSQETSKEASNETSKADAEEIPELIEPSGVSASYSLAQVRTLYNVDVHSAMVCPDCDFYEYETDYPFLGYGALPGDEVQAGDVLIYSQTENFDEQIESIDEEIEKLDADYVEYLSDSTVDLSDLKKAEYEASVSWADIKNAEPVSEDGTDLTNTAYYKMWAKAIMQVEGGYKKATLARKRLENQIEQRGELYLLDKDYALLRKQRINEKKTGANLDCSKAGTVVGVNYYVPGDRIGRGNECVIVADVNSKAIKCEFISKGTITKAQDVYAIFDGIRYEVEYEEIDPSEYKRLQSEDETIYSTFRISDPENKIVMGQYGSIIVVKEKAENALCVPTNCLSRDESGEYVYLYDGENSETARVKTGMKDGVFTEILDGLQAGDKVLGQIDALTSSKTTKLEKGSVSNMFSEGGFLFYPSCEWTTNPAKNATAYLKEICVTENQQVAKGDVLARLDVTPDNVEIARIERKIQREQERLNDILVKEADRSKDEEVDKYITRSVREKNKNIDSLMKQRDKLKEYSGIVEIKADFDGIVTDIAEIKEGDLISYKANLVQLSNMNNCFILIEDQEAKLYYGNQATVEFKAGTEILSAEGTVSTLGAYSLDNQMKLGFSLIRVPAEAASMLAQYGSAISENGNWWNRTMFTVKVVMRSMDNVVLVPKSAVKTIGGTNYVVVKTEDGLTLKSFIPGGSDTNNYWVAEGLEEGLEICLD